MTNAQAMTTGQNDGNFSPAWDMDDANFFYNQTFDGIQFPRLKLKNPPQNEYIIYSNATEYKIVQAGTALEAMEQCDIAKPYKILHAGGRLANIITRSKLEQAPEEEIATAPAEEVAEVQSTATQQPTAEQAAPQQPKPADPAAAEPQAQPKAAAPSSETNTEAAANAEKPA